MWPERRIFRLLRPFTQVLAKSSGGVGRLRPLVFEPCLQASDLVKNLKQLPCTEQKLMSMGKSAMLESMGEALLNDAECARWTQRKG